MSKPNLYKRMYAVSLDKVGLIGGTMSYSRRSAIEHFLLNMGEDVDPKMKMWEKFKRDGYRTVMARIHVIRRTA